MRQVSGSFQRKWSIVVGEPGEIPALFQTALDALVARATLVRGRRLLGPVLSRVTLPGTCYTNSNHGTRLAAQGVAPPTCLLKLTATKSSRSAVRQEWNKHRDAAPVGRVGFQPKLRQQKIFLGTRFHPQTKGYE